MTSLTKQLVFHGYLTDTTLSLSQFALGGILLMAF